MHPPPARHLHAFTLVQLLVALAISAVITLALVSFLGRGVTAEGQTLSQASATVQADGLSTAIAQDFRRTGGFVAFQQGDALGFTALFTDGPGLTVRNASSSFAQQAGFTDPGLNLSVGDLVLIVNSQGKAQLSQVTASGGGQVTTSCANSVAYLPDGVTIYRAHTLTLARSGAALTRSLDRQDPQVVLADASGAAFTYLYEQPGGPLVQDPAGLPASTTGKFRLAALLPRVTRSGSVNAVTSQAQVPTRPPAWAALPGARIGSCLPASPDVNAVTVRLSVTGLPSGSAANVTMRGPGIDGQRATASTNYPNLTPGTFGASAQNVTVNGVTYAPTVKPASLQLYGRGASGFLLAEYKPMTATLNVVVSGLPFAVNSYFSLRGGGAGTTNGAAPGALISNTTFLTPPGGTTPYLLTPGSWQVFGYPAYDSAGNRYDPGVSPASLNAASGQTYTLNVSYSRYVPPPPPPPPPPAPTPTPTPPPAGGLDFTMTASCGVATFTVSKTPTPGGSVSWDFGDGSGATYAPIRKSYPRDGSYTVTLTYTAPGGTVSRVSHTVSQSTSSVSTLRSYQRPTVRAIQRTVSQGGQQFGRTTFTDLTYFGMSQGSGDPNTAGFTTERNIEGGNLGIVDAGQSGSGIVVSGAISQVDVNHRLYRGVTYQLPSGTCISGLRLSGNVTTPARGFMIGYSLGAAVISGDPPQDPSDPPQAFWLSAQPGREGATVAATVNQSQGGFSAALPLAAIDRNSNLVNLAFMDTSQGYGVALSDLRLDLLSPVMTLVN